MFRRKSREPQNEFESALQQNIEEEIAMLRQRPSVPKKGDNSADKLLKKRKQSVKKKSEKSLKELVLEDDEPNNDNNEDHGRNGEGANGEGANGEGDGKKSDVQRRNDERRHHLQRSKTRTLTLKTSISNLTERAAIRNNTLRGTLSKSSLSRSALRSPPSPEGDNNNNSNSDINNDSNSDINNDGNNDDGNGRFSDNSARSPLLGSSRSRSGLLSPPSSGGSMRMTASAAQIMEFLNEELKQKEADLEMAAQMGLQLSNEYQALQEEYEQALHELDQSHQQVEALQNSVHALMGQVRDVERGSSVAGDRLVELDQENASLSDALQEAREEFVVMREQHTELERTHKAMRSKLTTLEDSIQAKDDLIHDLQTQLHTAQHASHHHHQHASPQEVERLRAMVVTLRQREEEARQEVQGLRGESRQAGMQKSELARRNERLEGAVEELKSRVEQLHISLSDAEASKGNALSTAKTHINSLIDQQLQLNTQLAAAHDAQHALQCEVAVLVQLLTLELCSSASQRGELKEVREQLEGAQDSARTAQSEKQQLATLLAELRAESEGLREQLEDAQDSALAAQHDRQQLAALLEALRAESEGLREQLDEAEERCKKADAVEHERDALHDNLEAVSHDNAELRATLAKVTQEFNALDREYSICRLARESVEEELQLASASDEERSEQIRVLTNEIHMLSAELNSALEGKESAERALGERHQQAMVDAVMAQVVMLTTMEDKAADKGKAVVESDDDDDESDNEGLAVVAVAEEHFHDPQGPPIDQDEKAVLVGCVNLHLRGDRDVAHRLPLSVDDGSLYAACQDGVLLCKLLSVLKEHALDVRVLNTPSGPLALTPDQVLENQHLLLNSCVAVGCHVASCTPEGLAKGRSAMVHCVVRELIRCSLFDRISPATCPELYRLLERGEELEVLTSLPKPTILCRWLNFHLTNAGHKKTVKALGPELKDCEAYVRVLHQLAPDAVPLSLLDAPDDLSRARSLLAAFHTAFPAAPRLITAEALASGHPTLTPIFVANLFLTRHGLRTLTVQESASVAQDFNVNVSGDRNARVYVLWMNSLGVDPPVNNIFENLRDGIVLLQLFDRMEPGTVSWQRVSTKRPVNKFNRIQNTNYAIELGRRFRFSLVGIAGANIEQGNRLLTLALVWQMMRYHIGVMLSRLGKGITDTQILDWANKKTKSGGKLRALGSFKDAGLRTSVFLLDLIDSIKPGVVDYRLVTPAEKDDECIANARYAISLARKLGATIFLSPEDIVEVKPRMVLTFVAALMAASVRAQA